MRRFAAAALVVFSILACRKSPEQPGVPESSRLTAEVDAYLQPFLDSGGFSGAVLMASGGRVLLDKGYGLASQEFGVPNTPRTKFQIASLSKTFTAAAIMILEERGKLSVRDPLARFIPDYPAGDKITIHHLLTHTSGIPNVNDFPEYDRESRYPHTLPQIIAMFKDKPLRFAPGDRYYYSNSNYNLLAFVIEKVSGLSYGDFLEKNIFGPLGMKDTAHRASDGVIVPLLATGYMPSGAWGLERAPFLDWTMKTGNGSLYSTVDDLYKWDRALQDGKLLSRPSLEAMFTDHASGMGYAWFVGKRSGRRAVRFNGRSPGFTSYLERYIDDDACIIILSNNYAPVPHTAIDGLRGILFGEPYTSLMMDRGFKADEASLETFAGRYKFGPDYYRPDAVVEIKMEAGDLKIVWSETYKSALRPMAKGVFLDRLFWATLIFQTDADGKVKGLIWRDTKDYPAVRVNPAKGIQWP
ncbi:MAG: serine hydrolase domain-containing protein [Candidatus Aminicenantales bacterium]